MKFDGSQGKNDISLSSLVREEIFYTTITLLSMKFAYRRTAVFGNT